MRRIKPQHTLGSVELDAEIKDMTALAHLQAEGQEFIDRSVMPSDWIEVHKAHDRFLQTLARAYDRKWKIGRKARK